MSLVDLLLASFIGLCALMIAFILAGFGYSLFRLWRNVSALDRPGAPSESAPVRPAKRSRPSGLAERALGS